MTKIVVVGTYDTKAKPLQMLERALVAAGEVPVTIDTGVFAADVTVTYSASAVAEAAGENHQDLASRGRAKAVRVMAQGAAAILSDLVSRGEVGALVLMGGSNASTVFTHLVPEVPLGIPKILMATPVSGDVRTLVDGADTLLFYPVVDVDGENSILRAMIKRLADTGRSGQVKRAHDRPGQRAASRAQHVWGYHTLRAKSGAPSADSGGGAAGVPRQRGRWHDA